eukprot:GHRQ01032431.1.p2 GENE.GHRQ01032431.1~~GHRQ01032431.1.p2  ORF type:complete len:111 (-),score=23.19 GHRQ01032431.1:427-759(-)
MPHPLNPTASTSSTPHAHASTLLSLSSFRANKQGNPNMLITSPRLAMTAITMEKKGKLYAIKADTEMQSRVTPSHTLRLLQLPEWWWASSCAYLQQQLAAAAIALRCGDP